MFLLYFFTGTCLGSFFLCITTRKSLIEFKRSHCDYCQAPLTIWQLIPIISYFTLNGKCHQCKHPIPLITLLIELFSGTILSLVYFISLYQTLSHIYTIHLISCWVLFMAIYDLIYYEIEWKHLIFLLFLCTMSYISFTHLIFVITLWLCLELIIIIRPHSFGGADSKIIAILSLTLPIQQIPYFLFFSALSGLGCFALNNNRDKIAFIPCLLLGYLLCQMLSFV